MLHVRRAASLTSGGGATAGIPPSLREPSASIRGIGQPLPNSIKTNLDRAWRSGAKASSAGHTRAEQHAAFGGKLYQEGAAPGIPATPP